MNGLMSAVTSMLDPLLDRTQSCVAMGTLGFWSKESKGPLTWRHLQSMGQRAG